MTGTVVERLEAPGYTYLRVKSGAGDTWVAVPTSAAAVGNQVSVRHPMPMENFQSKTLGRTFPVILFAGGAEIGGALNPSDLHAADSSPAPPVAAPKAVTVKVPRAAGPEGRTIAEIYAQRESLKDKTASVRGRVVKVTGGILGYNWLHLRDGSGGEATKDDDLIVTTTESVQLNDEVTAAGLVHTDKDLGSGYAYKVLIEDAKITR